MESHITIAKGVDVHYASTGEGKMAMVFVHGFGRDMNIWANQYEEFYKEDVKLIFIDLPGFGESDKPNTEYTLEMYSQCLHAIIEKENVHQAVLVGNGIGAAVCRYYALNHKDIASAICDINGAFCEYSNELLPTRIQILGNSVHHEDWKHKLNEYAQSLFVEHSPKEFKSALISEILSVPENVVKNVLHNFVDQKWWKGEWIDIPAVVFASNKDVAYEAKMQKVFANMDYVPLNDCGQFVQVERAGLVNAKLHYLLNYARTRKIERIDVNGVNLLYEVAGTGKPVLLFHGNGGRHEDLETTAGQLVRAGYKVYAIDSRGQGANARLNEYHYKDMAEDMHQFCKKLGIVRPAVFGFSDGGIICLQLEVLYPGTFSVIAVGGANVHPTGVVDYENFKANILAQHNPLPEMMVWEPNITSEMLATIKCPTLVMAGKNDLVVEDHTRYIAKCIPNSELTIFPGEDHGSYIWHSKKVGIRVMEFFNRHRYTYK